MKIEKSTGVARPRGLFFAGLLAVVLAVLFAKSFLPGYVHFSNDGPLGQQTAAWHQLPAAFTGSWYDINDIGSSAGTMAPAPSLLIYWALGPVGYAKFLAPIALFILGLGAWTFFRQLRFSPLAAVLGALAATLDSTYFGNACWGVAGHQIAVGMNFFALALVVSNTSETSLLIRWTRLALAGLAVGVNVMEAADIGAIFSIFVAAFVFFKVFADEGGAFLSKCGRGAGRVAIVAVFAGFIATQTVMSLVGSAIVGIAGTGQDTETKAAHWDFDTQWSLPRTETLGLFVPGLFGYRMDTPKDMMELFQDGYKGGNYWGAVGRDPALVRYFDGGKQGSPPLSGFMRFTSGTNYVGILVVLLAFWAMAQSLRRQNSIFPETQRRFIWFWSVALIGSLLLAWGRFGLFNGNPYRLLYALPYFSTMRNPTKFLLIFSWAIVILFAYGVNGLSRRYLDVPAGNLTSFSALLKNWWAKVRGFDRNWTHACVAALIISLLGWLVYASEKPGLVRYLQTVGFGDEDTAKQIAAFSIGQVGWFIILFAAAVGLCVLVIAGVFAGKRAKLGSILLGALLVGDLGRADLPYIIHWDYKQKYEVGSLNPIVDFLRDKPYEHRVAYGFPWPLQTPSQFELFGELYRIEWAQHHFPYYNIQSLDKIQMPRMPADLEAFEGVFRIGIKQDDSGQWTLAPATFPRAARLWQLTNTRYLLGPAALSDLFNEQLDPAQHRFRIVRRFAVVLKPGVEEFHQRLEELTAVPNDNGDYALFEFTGALPRAKLYTDWQTNSAAALKDFTTNGLGAEDLHLFDEAGTNGFLTLKKLASPSFDPQQAVLLDAPLPGANPGCMTNQNSGAVGFKSYAPKDIVFDAKAGAPSILLLNDMFDSHWQVFVDGKSAPMLRCNFIMRGVFLTPGAHTVEFKFSLPNRPLYVTLAAIVVGIFLGGLLVFLGRRAPPR